MKRKFIMATVTGPQTTQAQRVFLYVGREKMAFAIHNATVSHWASGYRIGSLNDARIRYMCIMGHNAKMNDRAAAQSVIDSIVIQKTAKVVLARFKSIGVINK